MHRKCASSYFTKKLTTSQIGALSRLSAGVADFYDLMRVGATGATLAWLVKNGLVTVIIHNSFKEWSITDAGHAALVTGQITVPTIKL